MIYDWIADHARNTPNAPAIIEADGSRTSYLELHQFLGAMMTVLRMDLPALERLEPVAVSCQSNRYHMLLMFALEALGITTVPFTQPIDPGVIDTVRQCALIIAEDHPQGARGAFFPIGPLWFDRVKALSGHVEAVAATWPDDKVVRLLNTSGSTGTAKAIPVPFKTSIRRAENRKQYYGFDCNSRFLVTMWATGPVTLVIRGLFLAGGALIFFSRHRVSECLGEATHACMLPVHVSEMLGVLPWNHVPSQSLKLFCIGAKLGPSVRANAKVRMGADILSPFGTNEVGTCALLDSEGAGALLPGVQIEVVDDNFKVLPYGVAGALRIRSDEMVPNYTDPALTAEHFRDGWFLSGDVGVMSDASHIRLTGRVQTLLNIGGVKYSPEIIEDELAGRCSAQDLAVCLVTGPDGTDELYVAIVNSRLDDRRLKRVAQAHLAAKFGRIHIVRVAKIARNSAGKIQRQILSEQLKQGHGVPVAA